MKSEDLFTAIGRVDEKYLWESEQPVHGRSKWRAVVIAAVIAALCLTTCAAAPMILGAIRDAKLEYSGTQNMSEYPPEPGGNPLQLLADVDHYSVVIDFELAQELPQSVETAYLPTFVPDAWWGERYWMDGDYALQGAWLEGDWGSLDGTVQSVLYTQTLLTEYNEANKEIHGFYVQSGGTVESRTFQAGDRQVLEVAQWEEDRVYLDTQTGQNIQSPGFTCRYYYWSDGEYLFFLMTPYDSDTAQIEAFIAGLAPGQKPTAIQDPALSTWKFEGKAWEEWLAEQENK